MIPIAETNKRKAEAIATLNQVIDQMAMADADLHSILRRNVGQLVEVCITHSYLGKSFQLSSNPLLQEKVNAILDKLRRDLFNIIYLRAENVSDLAYQKVNEEKSNKLLLLFLTAKIADMTLQDRIDQYVKHLRLEIEAYIAVGISKRLTGTQILNQYLFWLKSPYTSPMLIEAFRTTGFKAERIISKGISFGTGKYVSAFNNLKRLQQTTIFQAFNHTLNTIWQGNAAVIGWYTVRGSSYPCSLCDSFTGMFHPKDEFFYGYHLRCCCLMLPVYLSDIKSLRTKHTQISKF